MLKKNFLGLVIIIFTFLIDKISKVIILNLADSGLSNIKINSFLNFNLVWNEGIAFGLLSFDKELYYNSLTIIIIIITIILFFIMFGSTKTEKIGYAMIIGGSLGNITDRIYYSAVPDFIDINYNEFHWFVFNVADIFITVGLIILIYNEFLKKEKI